MSASTSEIDAGRPLPSEGEPPPAKPGSSSDGPRLRVYVAGAYGADNVLDVFANMRKGMQLGLEVLKAGFAPFVPWFDYHFALMSDMTLDEYYDYSMAWLEASQAVLVVPGWEESKGTKAEIARAKELRIPVFYSLWALDGWDFFHGHPREKAHKPCDCKAKEDETYWPHHRPRSVDAWQAKVAPPLKDSGKRRTFASDAVRDVVEGKGRFDLISPIALEALAKHYEAGAIKYADRNWEKGMPLSVFLDSAMRHINQLRLGLSDEPHAVAALWNLAGLVHTKEMIKRGLLPAELDDLPSYVKEGG